MPNPEDALAAESIRHRLRLLTAVESALGRADEVFATIRACRDLDAATRAVRELLGLDEVQAHAVLFQQWAGLTGDRADELRADIRAERSALASLTDRGPDPTPQA